MMSVCSPGPDDARREVAEALRRIYERGMTTTSGGNISVRIADESVIVTPAGLDKGAMTAEQIACVDASGAQRDGPPPSSELPTHLRIYRDRTDLRAIVHGHPPALVAFSICHETPDLAALPDARELCGPVGFAPYELTGTDRLAARIADVFRDGSDCVVLENHGVIVGGRTLDEARRRFEALESSAQIILLARRVGTIGTTDAAASEPQIDELRRGAPTSASLGGNEAGELCHLVRRADRHRLINQIGASISVRLDARHVLLTPAPIDPVTLTPDAFTVHSLDELTSSDDAGADLHRAVYARHASVRSIITAAPTHATAFAIANQTLDCRTIPESYILLRDVVDVPFDQSRSDPESIATILSPVRPAALLRNRGVLVLGDSPLRAFDRLEVLDATARALIDARSLAGLHPMSESALGELDDLVRRMFPED
jgi:L-fuculose-phosphate aldolase